MIVGIMWWWVEKVRVSRVFTVFISYSAPSLSTASLSSRPNQCWYGVKSKCVPRLPVIFRAWTDSGACSEIQCFEEVGCRVSYRLGSIVVDSELTVYE